jgi:negative elongation factor B
MVCNGLSNQALREKLVERLNELGQTEAPDRAKKIQDLLTKSFPVVKIKQLRPVVMTILKYIPNIDPYYLNVLVSHENWKLHHILSSS